MNTGFNFFPEKLHTTPVRITPFASSFFNYNKGGEAFYSIKDGNSSDVNTWETVSGRVGKIPASGDDVYIRQIVTQSANATINNLFISGSLLFETTPARALIVLGTVRSDGTINMSTTSHSITMYAERNYINAALFVPGNTSAMAFARVGNQWITPLLYRNLYVSGNGLKRVEADLTTLGVFQVNGSAACIFDFEFYNGTFGGQASIINGAILKKTNTGNFLFQGLFQVDNSRFLFDGNPTVECRGGCNFTNVSGASSNTGIGAWSFTTNNQVINGTNNFVVFLNPISIVGAITVSVQSTTITISDVINGTTGSSKLENRAGIAFNTLNAATNSMTTGIFDITTYANTVHFNGNYTYTLDTTRYATMWSLLVSGTGTKSLGINTTLLGSLTVSGSTGQLDVSTYTINIAGVCTIAGSNQATAMLVNTSGAAMVIGGLYTISQCTVNFSGNPNVELKGGFTCGGNTAVGTTTTGTGTWTFSTNNQNFSSTISAAGGTTIGCAILISGAITLTVPVTSTNAIVLTGTLDGNNASSTFDNRSVIEYHNAAAPMITGILQCNAAANTFKYNAAGNQDVTGGTYRTIEFGGSGVKKLLGNVVVNVSAGGSQSTTGTATIDLNGFTITTI